MVMANKMQILPLRRADNAATAVKIHETVAKPKSTRAGKPKVRTGCITCKIRRIKCDETKPACERCTSTGRRCDGYQIVTKNTGRVESSCSGSSASPQACLPVFRTSSAEARALEFFHARTVPALSGHFDKDFWGRLILQIGYTEPTVCHAIVALGAFHERREAIPLIQPLQPVRSKGLLVQATSLISDQLASSNHDEPFALSQYNKAISQLTSRIGSVTWTPEMTLLMCILFVCVEFLRGDAVQALRHFAGGMQIAVSAINDSHRDGLATKNALALQDSLLPFFNRLELLSSLWGVPITWDYMISPQEAIPDHFASIVEARNSIIHLLNLAMRFIGSTKIARYARTVSVQQRASQAEIREKLSIWHGQLVTYLSDKPSSSSDHLAARLLHIHHLIALIWLETCTEENDLRADDFQAEFETIVSLAESIIAHHSCRSPCQSSPSSSNFTFDMELVSPLYFTVITCRYPSLRRRALNMLSRMSKREGLWDSGAAAMIGRRIMELEEEKLVYSEDEMTNQLPADQQRIYNTEICSETGLSPRTHVVTFYRRAMDDVAREMAEERNRDGWTEKMKSMAGELPLWNVWREELDAHTGFSKITTDGAESPSGLLIQGEAPSQLVPPAPGRYTSWTEEYLDVLS